MSLVGIKIKDPLSMEISSPQALQRQMRVGDWHKAEPIQSDKVAPWCKLHKP